MSSVVGACAEIKTFAPCRVAAFDHNGALVDMIRLIQKRTRKRQRPYSE
jgi:hypothetical protein